MTLSSRREALQIIGGLGGLGVLTLIGCSSSNSTNAAAGTDDTSSTGDDDSTGTGDSSSNTSIGDSSFTDAGLDASGFAVGSGALIAATSYGDPFSSGAVGTTCAVYPTATKGPCHSNTYLRKDVSDGLVGLPTRFEFLVVDADCNPVPDAIIEIWYASPNGAYSEAAQAIDDGSGYSGSHSDLNSSFCTGNQSEALASNWLRGFQKGDANGRVTIDGIFPGWYSGRTAHVHFIITANGKTSVTSQLVFEKALTTAVYTKHGSYSSRGDQDTPVTTDNVVSGLDADTLTFAYAQQSDGALVCWKQISIG